MEALESDRQALASEPDSPLPSNYDSEETEPEEEVTDWQPSIDQMEWQEYKWKILAAKSKWRKLLELVQQTENDTGAKISLSLVLEPSWNNRRFYHHSSPGLTKLRPSNLGLSSTRFLLLK